MAGDLNGRQLVLDLGHRTALGREDFMVGSSNRSAVDWLDRWPDWPGRGLVLYGAAGSGKSHLASVWQAVSGAGLLTAGDETVLRQATAAHRPGECFVVEDVALPFDERALLHLYNAVTADGGFLLLTARVAPSAMALGLPDLASRLRGLPSAALSDPDDDLLAVVLMKQLADRQLVVPVEVVAYLVQRMERSFDTARRLAAALDHASLVEQKKIDKVLAGKVLARLETG
ncbi:MAG: DNA replication protein [Rhodospirillaceae bacterium]|nr:DNA replication protein [Rhodospirillaceae bacterium]